jgi:hypothetical protein
MSERKGVGSVRFGFSRGATMFPLNNRCLRKVAHPSRAAAERARRLTIGGGVGPKVYKCEYGDHWHVGHKARYQNRGLSA